MTRAACLSIDITPTEPIDLSGGPFGQSQGVLDPLQAFVLLLEVDNRFFCWVVVDAIYLPAEWTDPLREKIGEILGCPRENTMVSATHTHSGAAFMPLRQWGEVSSKYTDWVHRSIVAKLEEAKEALQPVTASFGSSPATGTTVNRRTPGGPVDETVSVLTFHNPDGRPIARVVHFTCHPVTLWGLENKFSPDFPGYLRDALSQSQSGIPVMFVNGAAGNINPVGFSPEATSIEYSKECAHRVFKAANDAILSAQPINLEPFDSNEMVEQVRLDPPPDPTHLHRLIEEATGHLDKEDPADAVAWLRKKEWASDLLSAIGEEKLEDHERLEIQSVRLGDLTILTLPGDPYVEIGIQMKEKSPSHHTLIAGFTNGMVGYLCTEKWQEEHGDQEKFIGYRLLSMPKETEGIIYRMTERLVKS